MAKKTYPYYYDEERKKPIISRINPEAFLVQDESLCSQNAPFYKWLNKNHFKHAWYKGHYEVCDWAFVNITHKLFAYGMPGVEIIKPIGDHAITIDEFMQIYNIYEKYKGLSTLEFEEDKSEQNTSSEQ